MNQRTKLLLLLLVMASPFVASYVAYYFWKPTGAMNYGELQSGKRIALESLKSLSEQEPQIQGRWVLLSVDSSTCGAACVRKLYIMRQVRLAQGKHMERIARVYVVDDDADPKATLAHEFEGTVLLKGTPAVLADLSGTAGVRQGIYLVDPLGNLVLRYPVDPDAGRMIKDLTRLLSVSQIG